MTKETFIQKCEDCLITKEQLHAHIERALHVGAVDLDKVPDDYRAVYPIMAAIYERTSNSMIYGASDPAEIRKLKRAKERVKKSFVW